MALAPPNELISTQNALKRTAMAWASGARIDMTDTRKLRHRAAKLCHTHYHAGIPLYRKACQRANVHGTPDIDTILDELLLPDDIFKSYPNELLDLRDFDGMNAWVSSISTAELDFCTDGLETIDEWLAAVAEHGIRLVFSSGTSGHLSFVPRDDATWGALTELPFLYLPYALAERGMLPAWKSALLKLAPGRIEPSRFAGLVQRYGLRATDGFFFAFSGGNQGIQLAGQELGKLTRKSHYLYPRDISAAAVRSIVRGPKSAAETSLVQEFLDTTIGDKNANYERLLRALSDCARTGRRVMLFGTPALLLEACDAVRRSGLTLKLPKGSGISYGGGWKSFTGERLPEEELLTMLEHTFGVPRAALSESYSMTEINAVMPKCAHARYHIPPFLETAIFDEALVRKHGEDQVGILGVIDPFATSYPGFLLTGDNVSLTHRSCPCGLQGPQILEIARSPGKEVKGCGGIMAAVNA
ncbi:MAG: hypothetical protein JKY37_14770 [Nannocystaceae bacterium]|nr:hypothetical protein [Nannocystaceae bacterium]